MQDTVHPSVLALARRVIDAARTGRPALADRGPRRLSVDRYRDPARYARERDVLFRRYPLVLAHASELPGRGACLTRDVCGLPVLLTRDGDGTAHAFLNSCRHRGTRLVAEEGCHRSALVCPYHGWTYALDGRLRHVPQLEAFPGLCVEETGLVALPTVERHGLIWVRPSVGGGSLDLDAHLGPLAAELDVLELSDYVVFTRAGALRKANWKLLAENFLEGYHVRQLHQKTLWRFFLDAIFAVEREGIHQRAVVGRRPAAEAEPADRPLLEQVTLTYFLFPNTHLVVSTDYINLIAFFPVAVDQLVWQHALLVPAARAGERELYERAFTMMEERTFSGEDVTMAEEAQACMATGANETLLFGRLEAGPLWFHETVDEALAKAS